jgi:hypothetical protein
MKNMRSKRGITYIGILSGSPLKRGNTWTCNAFQGSAVELEAKLICDPGAGRLREDTEGAEDMGGASAEGRWARLPRRCISRDTSLESYVRPYEACSQVDEDYNQIWHGLIEPIGTLDGEE